MKTYKVYFLSSQDKGYCLAIVNAENISKACELVTEHFKLNLHDIFSVEEFKDDKMPVAIYII